MVPIALAYIVCYFLIIENPRGSLLHILSSREFSKTDMQILSDAITVPGLKILP
jgi:hypothetical protein